MQRHTLRTVAIHAVNKRPLVLIWLVVWVPVLIFLAIRS